MAELDAALRETCTLTDEIRSVPSNVRVELRNFIHSPYLQCLWTLRLRLLSSFTIQTKGDGTSAYVQSNLHKTGGKKKKTQQTTKHKLPGRNASSGPPLDQAHPQNNWFSLEAWMCCASRQNTSQQSARHGTARRGASEGENSRGSVGGGDERGAKHRQGSEMRRGPYRILRAAASQHWPAFLLWPDSTHRGTHYLDDSH